MLPANMAEVLIKEVPYRHRSLNIAADRPEDPQTRGGKHPLHMEPRRTLGKLPKLMLGRVPLGCRTDPLSGWTRAEKDNQERNALGLPRIPTFYGLAVVRSTDKEVKR